MDCKDCPIIRTVGEELAQARMAVRDFRRDLKVWQRRLNETQPDDQTARMICGTSIQGLVVKLARASHQRDHCARLLELIKEAETHE